jgi:tetratricopeptide (TPR) repeat protein
MKRPGSWVLGPGFFRSAISLLLLCASATARPCAAQSETADALWAAERFEEAKIEYTKLLELEVGHVRANYRLGILLSWENKLDSALVMLRRARAGDRQDTDLEVMEARVLAWAGRTDESVAHYDSVIARAPDARDAWLGKGLALGWAGRYDEADAAFVGWLEREPDDEEALVGRARLRAWRGDLTGARTIYGNTLDRRPGSAAAIAGLAQIDRWEGREFAALARVDSALRIAPNDRDAMRLRRELRAALRPQARLEIGWGEDSDDNVVWWQHLTLTDRVSETIALSTSAGLFQATDPGTSGDRRSFEFGATINRGSTGFAAGLGVRQLVPESAGERNAVTGRATLSLRPSPEFRFGIGYSRLPFDETANLISRDLDVGSLETNIAYNPTRRLELSVGLGAGWVSDGNSRRSVTAAATWGVGRYFALGPVVRYTEYAEPGVGYFAPTPFRLLQLRGSFARQWNGWGVRVGGGAGYQRIDSGDGQEAWQVEGRLTRSLRIVDEIGIFGAITNAASASATGAFKYTSAGLVARIGL